MILRSKVMRLIFLNDLGLSDLAETGKPRKFGDDNSWTPLWPYF